MTDALAFCSALYAQLLEGLDLDAALDEAINVAGWPAEHDTVTGEVFALGTRRQMLERLIVREEERLARAARCGPSSELLAARARVAAARERLATL